MFLIAGALEGVGRQVVDETPARYAIALAMLAFWAAYFVGAGRDRDGDGVS